MPFSVTSYQSAYGLHDACLALYAQTRRHGFEPGALRILRNSRHGREMEDNRERVIKAGSRTDAAW